MNYPKARDVSITSKDSILTFSIEREWMINEEFTKNGSISSRHSSLEGYTIMGVFHSTSAIYFILKCKPDPHDPCNCPSLWQLVRIVPDEDSAKQIVYSMNISETESQILLDRFVKYDGTLWD